MGTTRWVLGRTLAAVVTPPLRSATFAERGFPGRNAVGSTRLERIPHAVLCGFEWGLGSRDAWELERRLELVDVDERGFAYEGATMAAVILDLATPWRSRPRTLGSRLTRTAAVMSGAGEAHTLLNLIGVGFAMAKLPRPLWSRISDLIPETTYPSSTRWLAVDGYGFDLAYFDTVTWIDRQVRPASYPWLDTPDYFLRAVDQGIGRALWFVCSGAVPDVSAAIGRFSADRQADLWSGLGLAATFAGGGTPESLRALVRQAREHTLHLCQGAAFAARARVDAGHVPAHTHAAASALTGRTTAALAALVQDSLALGTGGAAGWEQMRCRVRSDLTAVGPHDG